VTPLCYPFCEFFRIAVTSHAAQGKTVDQVIVSVPVAAFSEANQAQFYVSMSRAWASMLLFTDSKVALKEAVTRSERAAFSLRIEFKKRQCWRLAGGRGDAQSAMKLRFSPPTLS
jgi:hypothetical protein